MKILPQPEKCPFCHSEWKPSNPTQTTLDCSNIACLTQLQVRLYLRPLYDGWFLFAKINDKVCIWYGDGSFRMNRESQLVVPEMTVSAVQTLSNFQ